MSPTCSSPPVTSELRLKSESVAYKTFYNLWPHLLSPGSLLKVQTHTCTALFFPFHPDIQRVHCLVCFGSHVPFSVITLHKLAAPFFLAISILLICTVLFFFTAHIITWNMAWFFSLNTYLFGCAGSSLQHVESFNCGMQTLSCSMCDLVPWPGIKPRPFALGAQSLRPWTTTKAHNIVY